MPVNAKKQRANIELILLGFLVSLILKGLLDHVYSDQIERDKGWREILTVLINANPMALVVFLFALLRFMYGAYRFHEMGPSSSPWYRVLWDTLFTVLLFIGFYIAGLLIKYQPIQFYEMFAVIHFVDLIWFLPLVRWRRWPFSAGPESGDELAARFVFLDLLPLVIFLCFFWWSGLFESDPASTHPLWLLGSLLFLIGVIDLWWNGSLYFHKIDLIRRPYVSAALASSGDIYFAGPLFTQAEWRWNSDLAARLRAKSFTVILPQQIALDVLSETNAFDPDAIYQRNIEAMDRAHVIIAILDGADPDSGTSWECGYAHKAKKPVIGIRTDLRAAGDDPSTATNLMLGKSCRTIIQVPNGLRNDVDWVAEKVASALAALGSL
jgi:nucleoside 2-deoxyribosyltransferase